nr:hypothetical protein CFP56_71936 [Quercus suber]
MSGIEQDERTIRGRTKTIAPATATPPFNPSPSTPSTFFLRTERDIEKSTQQRGRKLFNNAIEPPACDASTGEALGESSFGVQSLEDTMNPSLMLGTSLSRVDSYGSEVSSDAAGEGPLLTSKKRKAGNPVHPKIAATGQRILSSEYIHTSSAASPSSLRSAESPLRLHMRRGSASSVNYSQPISPLRMSPRPESVRTGTPRSGSAKSFRSSGEESRTVDDTTGQAADPVDADGNGTAAQIDSASMPQLVMPSIAMPTRKPFTEKGKQMGKLRVMVVGPRGVGKTSLIQSILRSCEDVVHVDPPSTMTDLGESPEESDDADARSQFSEITASTRPYPSWWTDMESRRMLLRRKSMGEGVLERNLCFIDAPGFDGKDAMGQISSMLVDRMRRVASLESMSDTDMFSLLSGEGGVGIDVVLWLFDSTAPADSPRLDVNDAQKRFFQDLCKLTNVVPLVGRADTIESARVQEHKDQITSWLKDCSAETFSLSDVRHGVHHPVRPAEMPQEPFAVSSALSDDAETIDASVLMSSQYMAPLLPSDLTSLTQQLFDRDNISRMRHFAATKFLLWRQQNLSAHLNLEKNALLKFPRPDFGSPAATSTRSMVHESSKVLVPYGCSSYFRSSSPSVSDVSSLPADAISASAYTLEHTDEAIPSNTEPPFRQVRLARWAQDLQRSLDKERRRYQQMYLSHSPTDWLRNDGGESSDQQALVSTKSGASRPPRGRLGGAVAVLDPRDPLGVLAFSQTFRRRGFVALQLAAGSGLIGAVAFWILRHWSDVQAFFGSSGPPFIVASVPAIPPPSRGWFEEMDWRAFFGWRR